MISSSVDTAVGYRLPKRFGIVSLSGLIYSIKVSNIWMTVFGNPLASTFNRSIYPRAADPSQANSKLVETGARKMMNPQGRAKIGGQFRLNVA